MTLAEHYEAEGEVVAVETLSLERARSVAQVLGNVANPFAAMVECRSTAETETVVFDVEVEVPQEVIHDIRPSERIAVEFDRNDERSPEVFALRRDFPLVPHVNQRRREFPRSLCLYDRPFSEIKERWNSAAFVEWTRRWLALSAVNELHHVDQPLEPLLLLGNRRVILPAKYRDAREVHGCEVVHFRAPKWSDEERILVPTTSSDNSIAVVIASIVSEPRHHGVIRYTPKTLRELSELLEGGGIDLLEVLHGQLRSWFAGLGRNREKKRALVNAFILLVTQFPKTRIAGGPVEGPPENVAFLLLPEAGTVGDRIGAWKYFASTISTSSQKGVSGDGSNVAVEGLSVSYELTRSVAAALNGRARVDDRMTCVGVGALGSQVVMNLYRSGFGSWTLIDDDRHLPHNMARHELSGFWTGDPKAESLSLHMFSLFKEPATHIAANALKPGGDRERITKAFENADTILDMSASVAVARHLVFGIGEVGARRVSVFLNPTGTDLVVLAEDRARSLTLDVLELQLYRTVLKDSGLEGHLRRTEGRYRVGQSCRDVSFQLAQDLVALHAAIAARAIADLREIDGAQATVWRAQEDRSVVRTGIEASPVVRARCEGWDVVTDVELIRRLTSAREKKLPVETGGVLVGRVDVSRKIIYLVDTVLSPPDSVEWPTLYVRGCRGLRQQVEAIESKTDGALHYVGEWHSHPSKSSTKPSGDDRQVLEWLRERMSGYGLPPVMAIVGDSGRVSISVDRIPAEEVVLADGVPH